MAPTPLDGKTVAFLVAQEGVEEHRSRRWPFGRVRRFVSRSPQMRLVRPTMT